MGLLSETLVAPLGQSLSRLKSGVMTVLKSINRNPTRVVEERYCHSDVGDSGDGCSL